MARKNEEVIVEESDIMAIDRFRMGTDGKGVSTLVAFFDCPLKCKYCINDHCHDDYKYDTVRVSYTPKELINRLAKDEIYYLMSDGGVVFGGGEPLLQAEFIHKVCALANPKWNIRIETSLNVPWENVELLIDDIDEWIIDIKDMNPEIYQAYTKCSINLMKENLLKLRDLVPSERLHIRVPRIPQYNDEVDVESSVDWIMNNIYVESEVFDYIELNNDVITIESVLRKLGYNSFDEFVNGKFEPNKVWIEGESESRRNELNAMLSLSRDELDLLGEYVDDYLTKKKREIVKKEKGD